jgi:hypothetical protein
MSVPRQMQMHVTDVQRRMTDAGQQREQHHHQANAKTDKIESG